MKHDLPEHFTPLNVFLRVTCLDILVDLLLSEKNLYAQESGQKFFTKSDEMKVFTGMNYFMIINSLACVLMYWEYNSFVDNSGTQYVLTRTRFQAVLQNIYLANNTTLDELYKKYIMRPAINHFNADFMVD